MNMKGTSGYEFSAEGQSDMYARMISDTPERAEELMVNAFRDSTRWGFRPAHIEKILAAYHDTKYVK
jgi:hypothetical protein